MSQLPRVSFDGISPTNKAIFFVTPSYAYLFDHGHSFHASAINRLFENLPENLDEAESFVAVVDALPGPAAFLSDGKSYPDRSNYEGVALYISAEVLTQTEISGSDLKKLIRFRSASASTGKGESVQNLETFLTVSLPVANTIFVNGQLGTIFSQKWTRSINVGGKSSFGEDQTNPRRQLQNLEIGWHFSYGEDYYAQPRRLLRTDFVALTKPRLITGSMGNIISEIEVDDHKRVPSSTELEQIVPKYLKKCSQGNPDGTLRILAFILPRGTPPPHYDGQDKAFSPRSINRTLRRGGSLHRVTSGGGGWGSKKGLLSLQPETSYQQGAIVDEPLAFELDAEEPELPRNKTIVPGEGTRLIFCAHYELPPESPALDVNADVVIPAGTDHCTVVGSTVQAENQSPNLSDTSLDGISKSNMVHLPLHFGMLTTAPIEVRYEKQTLVNLDTPSYETEEYSTLMDVPYTTYIADETPQNEREVLKDTRSEDLKLTKYTFRDKISRSAGKGNRRLIRRVIPNKLGDVATSSDSEDAAKGDSDGV